MKYNDFIMHHVGQLPGDLIEFETGKILGQHKGFWFHTIGQRQGSGLSGGPWYVVNKDSVENKVFLSKNYYNIDRFKNSFEIANPNWILGSSPKDEDNLLIKLRHGKAFNNGKLENLNDSSYLVTLKNSDQGIAPGQFAVFYKDDICIGAGVISRSC